MNLEQALELLSVSAEAEPEQVRRAYLRLVKRHNPERDPEKFRSLREAYELICSTQAWSRTPSMVAVSVSEASGAEVELEPGVTAQAVASPDADVEEPRPAFELLDSPFPGDEDEEAWTTEEERAWFELLQKEQFESLGTRLIASFATRSASRSLPSPRLVVHCILGLESQSESDLAGQLRELCLAEVEESGRALEMAQQAGLRWFVAVELSRKDMSWSELRAAARCYPALARACLAGDLDRAGRRLARWHFLPWSDARALARHHSRHALVLWQVCAPASNPGLAKAFRIVRRIALPVLFLVGANLLFRSASSPHRSEQRWSRETSPLVENLRRAASLPGVELPPGRRELVQALIGDLAAGDCGGARQHWTSLYETTRDANLATRNFVKSAASAGTALCDRP